MKRGTARLIPIVCLGLILSASPGPARAQGTESGLLAGKVVDRDILNDQGEKIGEVDDLVIRRSGKVKKMTLEVGGFLDAFDKVVGVSFAHVEVKKDGPVSVDASVEELERMPAYDYHEKGLRPEYYYRSRPYTGPPLRVPRGYYFRPEPLYPSPARWAHSPSRYLASVVMDRALINLRGRNVAMVEDLVIGEDGGVRAFVLSAVRTLGEGVYVWVPYRPPGFSAYGLVYDITREELKERPRYPYGK
jgi:sporulation protein YlmC with PRC-barrel domain